MDFPGSDGAANIKEEDSNAMFSWSSDVPRLIEISDDELDSVLPDIPHRPERATATIKEEDSDVQFLWSSDMPRLIEISDEEQEAAVSNIPEYLEKASSPTNAANVVLPQVLKLGKSVLQTQKPRPKFTAEQISKMKQFQKVLAERATGKRMPSTPVTGDADGIWSKCPGPAQGANESQRNDPRNSGNENERAGSLEMIEIDEDPATVFVPRLIFSIDCANRIMQICGEKEGVQSEETGGNKQLRRRYHVQESRECRDRPPQKTQGRL